MRATLQYYYEAFNGSAKRIDAYSDAGVYKLTATSANDQFVIYIGESANIEKRIAEHKSELFNEHKKLKLAMAAGMRVDGLADYGLYEMAASLIEQGYTIMASPIIGWKPNAAEKTDKLSRLKLESFVMAYYMTTGTAKLANKNTVYADEFAELIREENLGISEDRNNCTDKLWEDICRVNAVSFGKYDEIIGGYANYSRRVAPELPVNEYALCRQCFANGLDEELEAQLVTHKLRVDFMVGFDKEVMADYPGLPLDEAHRQYNIDWQARMAAHSAQVEQERAERRSTKLAKKAAK